MQIMMPSKNPNITELKRIIATVIGALIYAIGVNLFIVPVGLYNGGVMGFCQLIRTVLIRYLHVSFSFDFAGILYFIINIPILIAAWRNLEHRFVIRTVITVIISTVFLTIIPTKELISNDILASSLVGGAITGLGTGLSFWGSASGGGTDVIGFIMIKHRPNFTIGKVNLIVDIVIYLICLFMFNVQTAIYSIVYAFVCAIVMDRIHQQNINVEAIIVTNAPADELKKELLEVLDRGITLLPAEGGYTGEKKVAFLIVTSKYEVGELNAIVRKYDPDAFITLKENTKIIGNFQKRL